MASALTSFSVEINGSPVTQQLPQLKVVAAPIAAVALADQNGNRVDNIPSSQAASQVSFYLVGQDQFQNSVEFQLAPKTDECKKLNVFSCYFTSNSDDCRWDFWNLRCESVKQQSIKKNIASTQIKVSLDGSPVSYSSEYVNGLLKVGAAATKAGQYKIEFSNNLSAPVFFSVSSGEIDASKSVAKLQTSSSLKAGEVTRIRVDCFDRWGNSVAATADDLKDFAYSVDGLSAGQVTLLDGSVWIDHQLTKAATHLFEVSYKSQKIPMTKGSVKVAFNQDKIDFANSPLQSFDAATLQKVLMQETSTITSQNTQFIAIFLYIADVYENVLHKSDLDDTLKSQFSV